MVKVNADVPKKHVTSILMVETDLTSSWWGQLIVSKKWEISELGSLLSVTQYGCGLIYGHTPSLSPNQVSIPCLNE
jgi:hypothetical protein